MYRIKISLNVKEVIFQIKDMSIVLQKFTGFSSRSPHALIYLFWKTCLIFCRITDTLLILLGTVPEMLWVDSDVMEEPYPALKQHLYSYGPAALGCYKNHIYLLLYCPCLENLGACSAHAPTKQLPAVSATEWLLHCLTAELPLKPQHRQHATWAAQGLVMQGHAHSTGTVPLPFSPHRKGQKRREKARNQYKRKEWSNEQHICDNLQRQRNCRFCSVFPLVNVHPSDLFKKWCCDG